MNDLEITMVVLALLFIAFFAMVHYIAEKEIKELVGEKLKKKLKSKINKVIKAHDVQIFQVELALQKINKLLYAAQRIGIKETFDTDNQS